MRESCLCCHIRARAWFCLLLAGRDELSDGIDLVAVKVETSETGLYGLGCGTFTQRYTLAKNAVEEYLKPLLLGKSADNIEDICSVD